ncbi:polysaccharide deacetylase family protein [Xylanivirga thermophila]|uniref:polysaccharide deacetylase family protein n=1 Tax=Xylanivirga thermophila TaxID=2496273 RepID=UPI0013EC4EBD
MYHGSAGYIFIKNQLSAHVTTPQIVDILDNYNVPATFFFIGKNIEKYPSICEKIISSDHQIATIAFLT